MKSWIFVFLFFASATVWLRLSITAVTQQIRQTRRELKKVENEKKNLELKLVQLKSPKRLEKLAQSYDQLRPPKAEQIIYLPIEENP